MFVKTKDILTSINRDIIVRGELSEAYGFTYRRFSNSFTKLFWIYSCGNM